MRRRARRRKKALRFQRVQLSGVGRKLEDPICGCRRGREESPTRQLPTDGKYIFNSSVTLCGLVHICPAVLGAWNSCHGPAEEHHSNRRCRGALRADKQEGLIERGELAPSQFLLKVPAVILGAGHSLVSQVSWMMFQNILSQTVLQALLEMITCWYCSFNDSKSYREQRPLIGRS